MTYDKRMSDVKAGLPFDIDLANELKYAEERYLRLLDRLAGASDNDGRPLYDGRSISLARTKMQEANMWAVRAIFQPSRIYLLPEEKAEADADAAAKQPHHETSAEKA